MDLCGRLADGGGDVTEGRLKRRRLIEVIAEYRPEGHSKSTDPA
jgi:hypothetical protein